MSKLSPIMDELVTKKLETLAEHINLQLNKNTLDETFLQTLQDTYNELNLKKIVNPTVELENIFENFLLYRKPLTTHKINFPIGDMVAMIKVLCLCRDKFDSVSGLYLATLSTKYRLKLDRTYDLIESFKVALYPDERIKSATLSIGFALPKDKQKRALLKEGKLDDKDRIFFDTKELISEFYPIKTLRNIEGDTIKFSDCPFFITPFEQYSLTVEIENQSDSNTPRAIGINCILLNNTIRGELLYSETYKKVNTLLGKVKKSIL